MPAGRPTNYTPELLAAAHEYVDGGWMIVDVIPTVAGLAATIGVARETCHVWKHDPEKWEFSNILEKLMQTQERELLNNGLQGKYNAPITKMVLTKHGYSDKVEQDHTSSDGSMTPQKVEWVIVNPDKGE